MTRLVLIALLILLISGQAFAEWVSLGEPAPASGVTVYFDPDTLRRKGDVVKWWELYDYKVTQTVSGNSFLSIKAQNEYDCAEERIRTLAMSEFSGNMGTGTVIYTSSDVGKWAPVQPASLGQTMWEGACAKK